MDAEDFLDADELEAMRAPRGKGPGAARDPDSLLYKDACEACSNPLTWIDPAFICAFECTWCPDCAEAQGMVCPNCSGELILRPRRTQPIGRK